MIDKVLLQYAVKSKNFVAELSAKTQENYYSVEIRIAMKILLDYFKVYRQIPSYEVACEYTSIYPDQNNIKALLKEAYNADKEALVDGDFPFYVDKLKTQYNGVYLKEQISFLAKVSDIDDANKRIKKIALEIDGLRNTSTHSQGTLRESARQRLVEYKERRDNPELARGVLCGFKELDKITNGFKGSELILVSGSSGTGKSLILMNMCLNAWKGTNHIEMLPDQYNNTGKNIWYITIENPRHMLERRLDACLSGVNCDHIRDGSMTPEEYQLFLKNLKFQDNYGNEKHFYTSDLGRGITVGRIEAEYEKICAKFEPDIIAIDYLGIMKPNNVTGQDWLDQGSIAADLHEFSRAINKPVLTASQMKGSMRTQTGTKQFAGDPESVARSKMITDNVNLNLQIAKDADFHISSYLKLHVAKNRDGRTGDVITLAKEFWRQRVCDIPSSIDIGV